MKKTDGGFGRRAVKDCLARTNRYPLVWIVILNWNRPEDTIECISSLRQSDYPCFRTLVVDNGSTDESVDILRGQSGIDLLVNERNLGFAAGSNRGIEYALQNDAEYVLIMNNDTTVSQSMVSRLTEAAEKDPRRGIVGPVIYYADRPEKVWFAGMRFRHGLYVIRKGLHLTPPLQPVEEVDFISGCAMLVRRDVWEHVGLFDPGFFMYYEDLDLCLRARKAGYQIACVTEAHMWHALSASTGGPESPRKQYYQVKSCILFCKKHTRGLNRIAHLAIRLSHAALVAFQQILQGRLQWKAVRMYMKGLAEAERESFTDESASS
ncbi:MAG: glycosyltransferase family 2 protein [bacterium]